MADDLTQTQEAGGEAYQRARERSLQQRRAPGQVPGYQMVRCLGEGAYREVWLATQQSNPAHRAAVKFYTRRGGDWSSLAREVEKLNILTTDRYIVQLLDVGWDANPPYYVMEYLENGSLANRLEAGPLDVAEAVTLLPPAADYPQLRDEHLAAYEAALSEFQAGRWSEAYELLHKVPPEDRVKDFSTICIAQRNRVAPSDWNGVIVLSEKR
jgi:hypothetical protein